MGFHRQQALASTERARIERAVEDAALEVAERWGGAVRDLAFDEADLGAAEIRVRGDVAGLSAIGRDAGELAGDPTTFDDVDDVHGLVVNEAVEVDGGSLAFRVTFEARYAQPVSFAPAAGPTTAKLVTITVEEVGGGHGHRPAVRLQSPVRATPAKQFLHN